ncbi:coenzyme A pyrophosphatase [Roseateles aquatilis]|uniref:Coenzyme A pyrophosphatase n=1 Tax=Roseateles aquatilis TaxID=431061 RepID=A0A246J888_9BURK|nr:CoA pyrophosphatase [Roseateles aquatilis]OWQ88762.1 coenzyme A pyrophosphatase [Roseateles aquatilis]
MSTPPSRPAIKDPRVVPVSGTDAHLPAVPRERLTAAWLRDRFLHPPASLEPEIPGDGGVFPGREATQAAVLIPLVQRAEGLQVLLTQRTAHLRDHAGQISFPGGRAEPEDGSPERTALREAEEEIGLHGAFVDLIGQLPVYRTVTAYEVTPVVALVRPGFDLRLDSFEVAEAFEVPLEFLMNPAHHHRHDFEYEIAGGFGRRQFLSMPWTGPGLAVSSADPDVALTAATPKEFFIWGATAAMLRNLYRFLRA